MAYITFCPHFLISEDTDNPNEIERDLISPLLKFFNLAISRKVSITTSNSIINYCKNNFPWNHSSDNAWKGFIKTWSMLVNSKLQKCAYFIDVDAVNVPDHQVCSRISTELNGYLYNFLDKYKQQFDHIHIKEKGIFIDNSCGNGYNYLPCLKIKSSYELNFIIFPWLKEYDEKLPTDGDFPFNPPLDWQGRASKKGIKDGYIDNNGNEWVWDKLHRNHWDVQLKNGEHYNVTTNGQML